MSERSIYIAGAVTGRDINEVRQKFADYEAKLIAEGHEVSNPVAYIEEVGMQDDSWEDIMTVCLILLLTCNEIHMLPCWKDSPGAQMEHDIFKKLNKTIVYL